eukprot:11163_1
MELTRQRRFSSTVLDFRNVCLHFINPLPKKYKIRQKHFKPRMAAMQITKFETKENNENDNTKQEIKPILRKDIKQFKIKDTINIELIDKGSYVEIPTNLNINDKDIISCICISDTHGQHNQIEEKFNKLPTADILIHSGDFTKIGHWGDIKSYDKWIKNKLNNKKFKYCILIGGNHDITLDCEYYIKSG